jgi:hypothetical protein
MVAEVRERRNRPPNVNGDHITRNERRSGDVIATCPVCLCDTEFPVETNCGHLFCG